jgi:serine/threonine protein kinase
MSALNQETESTRTDEIVAAYLCALDAGQSPQPSEWIARHPELADELRDCFDAMDEVNRLAAPIRPALITVPDNATPYGEAPTAPPTGLSSVAESHAPCSGLFGDYELDHEIARGGMGVVYKARQISLNRVVAIKMILARQLANQEDVQRFRAEAQAAACLKHPNIVAIHEVGEVAGQHFFSMDFIDGPSLSECVREHPLHPRVAAQLMQTIAGAVHYAHQQGILHRDLKPSNVLLEPREVRGKDPVRDRQQFSTMLSSGSQHLVLSSRPVVTDFGLAKRIEGGSNLTSPGQILGTPSYMPPEQAAARHDELGAASDVYALGAILYELVTGRAPFRAQTALDTLVQVLESEPVSPRLLNRSIPRDLETICMKCLEKESRRRYATAQQLADDLGRFCAGEPIIARAISPIERTWRWCLRRPAWAAMIAACAIATVLICSGSWWFTGQISRELARTEQKQHELQIALARQVAERLDSDLRQLASVPRTLARLLSDRTDWTVQQIDASLQDLLNSDPRLFGMCVAFEPFQFDAGRENFARYAWRGEVTEIKFLHPPEYKLYRDWDWYRFPKRDSQSRWTEPYMDTGGGNVPMVTFSAPVTRNGQFAGVVTADLSLAYFRHLKTWLDELQVARGDYGFVISPKGKFISDANPDYQMGRSITEFARPDLDAGYTTLLELIQSRSPGSVKGIDFWTGNPVTFLVAPVSSSGWSFVAVLPDQSYFVAAASR